MASNLALAHDAWKAEIQLVQFRVLPLENVKGGYPHV